MVVVSQNKLYCEVIVDNKGILHKALYSCGQLWASLQQCGYCGDKKQRDKNKSLASSPFTSEMPSLMDFIRGSFKCLCGGQVYWNSHINERVRSILGL